MLNGKLSWVGYGNQIANEKDPARSYQRKVFEVPFKLSGSSNKYFLRMVIEKNKRKTFYYQSFYEILSEDRGVIDALLIDEQVSPRDKLFLEIINSKSLRFRLIGFFGIFHLFRRYK